MMVRLTAVQMHLVPLNCMGTMVKVVCFMFCAFHHGGSESKESACSAGDLGSTLGLGRSLGEGNGNPLQCSCLENSMDRGYNPCDGQESEMTEQPTLCHTHTKKKPQNTCFMWPCDTAILLLGIYLDKILIQIIHASQCSWQHYLQ